MTSRQKKLAPGQERDHRKAFKGGDIPADSVPQDSTGDEGEIKESHTLITVGTTLASSGEDLSCQREAERAPRRRARHEVSRRRSYTGTPGRDDGDREEDPTKALVSRRRSYTGAPGRNDGECEEDPTEALTEKIARLGVGDAALIRRNDGRWSRAVVKERSDAALTFQLDPRHSKIIERPQWAALVRPERAGARGRRASTSTGDVASAAASLEVDDEVLVQRSDGQWAPAVVKRRTREADPRLTFQIDRAGRTKSIRASQCRGHVRCLTSPQR